MGIEIKNGDVILRAVKTKLDGLEQRFDQALKDEAARLVIRTRKGQDVNGAPFVPYSPGYAAFRTANRRKTDPVDLTFSGKMLAAIQTTVKKTSTGLLGIIGFASALEGAKASGNMKRRNFFGLSEEQVARLRKKLTE